MPETPDGVEPVEVEARPVLEDDRAQVELVRARADAVGDPGRDLRAGEPGRLVEVLDVDIIGFAGRRAVPAALGCEIDLARRVFLEPALDARLDDVEHDRAEAAVGPDGADVAGDEQAGRAAGDRGRAERAPLRRSRPPCSGRRELAGAASSGCSGCPPTLTVAVVVIEPRHRS